MEKKSCATDFFFSRDEGKTKGRRFGLANPKGKKKTY